MGEPDDAVATARGLRDRLSAPQRPAARIADTTTVLTAVIAARSSVGVLLVSETLLLYGKGCLQLMMAGPTRWQQDHAPRGDAVLAIEAHNYLSMAAECARVCASWCKAHRTNRANLPPAGASAEYSEVRPVSV